MTAALSPEAILEHLDGDWDEGEPVWLLGMVPDHGSNDPPLEWGGLAFERKEAMFVDCPVKAMWTHIRVSWRKPTEAFLLGVSFTKDRAESAIVELVPPLRTDW